MSVPLALLTRTVMLRFGAFAMVPPKTGISPVDLWPEHAVLTFRAIRTLFGAFGAVVPGPGSTGLAGAFGLVCLLAAAFGFAKVVWTWRTASRAEQLLCVAIVVNLAAYLFSTMPETYSSREVAAVLPCGAVLAARACVPGRIANATRAGLALATAALVALLPLSAGAAQRPVTPTAVPLAAWLEAHGLRYGIAGYWDASAVTLQSGNRVQIRAIIGIDARFFPCYWETEPSWYNPVTA